MKTASSALKTYLANNRNLIFADLWTITTKSGVVLNYTTWDRDLTVGGVVYKSHDVILKQGKFKQTRGLEINQVDLTCYPSLGNQGNIPPSMVNGVPFLKAIRTGIFDRAVVQRQRLYMPTPGDTSLGTITLFLGEIIDGNPSQNIGIFKCADATNLLNIYMPRRQYQPTCAWTFGDSNCTFNKAALTVNSAVGQGSSGTIIYAALTEASGYFNYGTVKFLSGVNAGWSRAIKTYARGQITLTGPFPSQPAVGDQFAITPGCSKTLNGFTEQFNGAVQSGLTPSSIFNSLGNPAGQFNGYTLTFTSGALNGMSSVISAWTPQLAILVTPFNQTPSNGDTFTITAPGSFAPSAYGVAETIVSGILIPIGLSMADGFFNNATALFTSGQNIGQSAIVANWQNQIATLQSSLPYAPVVGDTLTLTTATTQTLATCTGYNNTQNFGGQDQIPIPETAY